MVSHPESDILECEVRWPLRSSAINKVSGCDEIPVELFKSLKDGAIEVLRSLCQQIWKPSSGHSTRKGQSSSQFPRRVVPENVITAEQSHSFPVLVRSRLHARLQHYVNQELQMSKLGLEKEEKLEIKLPTFADYRDSKGISEKHLISVSSTTLKPLTVWVMTKSGKLLERWEYQTILPVS